MNHFNKFRAVSAQAISDLKIAHFNVCRSGSAIVEFALILPILITMLVGAAEVSQALTAERKLIRATTILGDMITREPIQSRQSINQMFDAVEAIADTALVQQLRIKASAVELDPAGDGYRVVWSQARRQPADRTGLPFVPEEGEPLTADFYIVVTMQSKHSGRLTTIFVDELTLFERFEFRPRDSDRIDLVNHTWPTSSFAKNVTQINSILS